MVPETRYAKTRDSIHIAYHVVGDGPFTVVAIPGWHGNLEVMWEQPLLASFYEKLGQTGRVIHHDRRGTGLSDRTIGLPDLETWVDDLCAVLDKIGARRVVPLGMGEGVPFAVMFAASRPERTAALVLYGARVKGSASDDYPWAGADQDREEEMRMAEEGWGTESYAAWFLSTDDPSLQDDRELIRWVAKVQRHWVSPGGAAAMIDQLYETDVRHLLGAIRCPTLVLKRVGWDSGDEDDHVASLIPSATLEVLPGGNLMPWIEDQDGFVSAIDRFLQVQRPSPRADRVLATVLFTDIAGSTEMAAQLGDAGWRMLLERHHERVRVLLGRYRGREIDTAGDGFLASFDGPARAVRCARAIGDSVRELGIHIRAGLHTGEVEFVGDGVRGIAVHIGARIAALAAPGDIFVSATVKDLVAGSGLEFEDHGEHELKGVPGKWRMYSLAAG
jgi:class 3 adenylate cyclase/alpha-beta hydrolase superfamily lysophospholipase